MLGPRALQTRARHAAPPCACPALSARQRTGARRARRWSLGARTIRCWSERRTGFIWVLGSKRLYAHADWSGRFGLAFVALALHI